ncbi:armadillo repeat-containing protein 7 [Cocos nucifera]|nr:armadillo repeat-containing protein 7 [Cocos nucifera]
MFTNDQRQLERTGKYGTPRSQYLQNMLFIQLNVLELFLDCIMEPNEKLVEFGVGDPANAAVIIECGGIPLILQCLSSPVRNTVSYALGALYYLCNPLTKKEILKPEVVEVIRKYAAAEGVNVTFSNLADAFLDKHVNQ